MIKSYQEILSYYKSQILFELTVMLVRLNGKDILEYWGGRIGSEMRLVVSC